MEEHLRSVAVEFEIAEFVDVQKVDASVAGDGLAQLRVVGRFDELVHEGGCSGVADGVASNGSMRAGCARCYGFPARRDEARLPVPPAPASGSP